MHGQVEREVCFAGGVKLMLPRHLSSQGGACEPGLLQKLQLLRLLQLLRGAEAFHMQSHSVASTRCSPRTSAHPAASKPVLPAHNPSPSCRLASARDHCRTPAATHAGAARAWVATGDAATACGTSVFGGERRVESGRQRSWQVGALGLWAGP